MRHLERGAAGPAGRRHLVLVTAVAAGATVVVVVLWLSGAAFSGHSGAPSIQAAVDQYVGAVRAGNGAEMAAVLGDGYSVQARTDRIRKADGHPVAVTAVTFRDMPSDAWKTVVLHLDDGGVRLTEELMVGPAPDEFQGDPRRWEIFLRGNGPGLASKTAARRPDDLDPVAGGNGTEYIGARDGRAARR